MIEAKTLRALAKHSGYKPSSIFRMQPSEILEMLTEKYPDVKEWDEAKAKSVIDDLLKKTSEPAVQAEEPKAEPVQKTESKSKEKAEPKKRTRRTKAQIAADKAAAEAEAASKAETTDTEREKPNRRRKKTSPVLAESVSSGGVSSEDVAVLKELVGCLQEDVQRLTRMVDDVSMFMAWFHNVKVDPREPIEHLGSIDWDACIKDQMSK